MSRFKDIMNNHPELVKEIFASIDNIFTLFSGEVVEEVPAGDYFGYGNRVFPNLEKYTEISDGGDIIVDLSKSKNLKEVILDNFGHYIKGKTAKALQKAKVTLYTVNIKEYSMIKKLFPNSKITYNERDMVMEIEPAKKQPATKKQPKAGPSKPNCKKYGCTVKPRNGEFCSKHK